MRVLVHGHRRCRAGSFVPLLHPCSCFSSDRQEPRKFLNHSVAVLCQQRLLQHFLQLLHNKSLRGIKSIFSAKSYFSCCLIIILQSSAGILCDRDINNNISGQRTERWKPVTHVYILQWMCPYRLILWFVLLFGKNTSIYYWNGATEQQNNSLK